MCSNPSLPLLSIEAVIGVWVSSSGQIDLFENDLNLISYNHK